MKSIDTNADGKIAYTEFIAASLEKGLYMKEERLFQAFRLFDINNNGKIDKSELRELLGSMKLFDVRGIVWY